MLEIPYMLFLLKFGWDDIANILFYMIKISTHPCDIECTMLWPETNIILYNKSIILQFFKF